MVKEKFGHNTVELDKVASWLKDSYQKGELGTLLVHSDVNPGGSAVNTLSTELANIPIRLKSGLRKPEVFSDQRITSLISKLNQYKNYLDTFESIEISNYDNCLDLNKYLISPRLHDTLINGYKLSKDRTINKREKGMFMVVFKTIKNEGKDVLIYKYIKYPTIFYECLESYIKIASSSLIVTNDICKGMDYIFFVLQNKENLTSGEFISEINKLKLDFDYKLANNNPTGIYPRNPVDMCKMLLSGCPIYGDEETMVDFIKLSLDRKLYDVMVKAINLYDFYGESFTKTSYDKFNFLSRVIFVTDDLDGLLKEIKVSIDGSVNQGPQTWRGQNDSLSHVINTIDTDFRLSMNRHNQYHVNKGNILRNNLIGRSKFSYQNIHLNIGNVRWYSTERTVPTIKREYPTVYYDIK